MLQVAFLVPFIAGGHLLGAAVAQQGDLDKQRGVVQAEIDRGTRAGLTSEERVRMRELERENKELRRANEILKSAAAFFGAELDRRSSK